MAKIFTKINLHPSIFTLVFALVVSFILFVPPQIGIANSGDFGRIMEIFDLFYVPDYSSFKHFYDTFTFGRPGMGSQYNGYVATSSIFIFFALAINKIFTLFSNENVFYIYSLSLLYTITYIVGFYLLIKTIYTQIVNKYVAAAISFIALIILTDSLFIAYFNSFFQEAGFVVCCLLFIACFLNYKSFFLDITLLTLIIFSKEQNLLYLLLLFPIFIKYGVNLKRILLAGIFLLLPFYVYININTYNKSINTFDGLFSGLLHNDTQEAGTQVLNQLNLDPRYAIFTGKEYWGVIGELRASQNQENYLLWQQALADSTHEKILQGYMHNPQKMLINSMDYLTLVQKDGPFAPNLGNYKVDQDEKFRVTSFHIFSNLLKNIGFVMLSNLVLCSLLIMYYFKTYKKDMGAKDEIAYSLVTITTLNIISLIAIPISIFGSGFEEEVKHLFNVYFTESIILILTIVLVCAMLAPKLKLSHLSRGK